MRVKFIKPEKTREFKDGQIIEAERVKSSIKSAPLISIKNAWGERYAYPASWFEIVEDNTV